MTHRPSSPPSFPLANPPAWFASARPAALALSAALLALAAPVAAQNWDAMIQQQMNLMNQGVARAQQQVQQVVAQRMRDPSVRDGYQRYRQQMQAAGRAPMDYPTYAYYHVYTNGFSAQGTAQMRANEGAIARQERAAVAGVRSAEATRGAAQQAQRDAYAANQQEAGRGLMGQSTYSGAVGSRVLPHTWQPNTVHDHRGHRYWVDHAGQYHVLGQDGWWYPLSR